MGETDALQVLAQQDVLVTPRLRHLELFTMRGLLTLLWHHPAGRSPARPAAVVACGGAMGGLLGPADGLYHRLGSALAECGIHAARVLSPSQRPRFVRAIAGHGELVILPGDGHLMAKSGAALWERLGEWLPAVLGEAFELPLDDTFGHGSS